MTHTCAFALWQMVVLKHDPDRLERMVVQVAIGGTGPRYAIGLAEKETWHYEAELEPAKTHKRRAGFNIETP